LGPVAYITPSTTSGVISEIDARIEYTHCSDTSPTLFTVIDQRAVAIAVEPSVIGGPVARLGLKISFEARIKKGPGSFFGGGPSKKKEPGPFSPFSVLRYAMRLAARRRCLQRGIAEVVSRVIVAASLSIEIRRPSSV